MYGHVHTAHGAAVAAGPTRLPACAARAGARVQPEHNAPLPAPARCRVVVHADVYGDGADAGPSAAELAAAEELQYAEEHGAEEARLREADTALCVRMSATERRRRDLILLGATLPTGGGGSSSSSSDSIAREEVRLLGAERCAQLQRQAQAQRLVQLRAEECERERAEVLRRAAAAEAQRAAEAETRAAAEAARVAAEEARLESEFALESAGAAAGEEVRRLDAEMLARHSRTRAERARSDARFRGAIVAETAARLPPAAHALPSPCACADDALRHSVEDCADNCPFFRNAPLWEGMIAQMLELLGADPAAAALLPLPHQRCDI